MGIPRKLEDQSMEHRSSHLPTFKESEKWSKRSAWMSQHLLVKQKGKKEMHKQWKLRQVSWEDFRETLPTCVGVRPRRPRHKGR